ncbi:MAG: glycosyltransferase family 2 protein [Nitrospirae bacterium]|nr:glycosyltransferase family 2 protein [Nitrospirota bacterium]
MKINDPRVSIVIPARNASHDLRKCLDAIAGLKRDDTEVIVVDDASVDETPALANEFGCTVLTFAEQSGPAKARNKGAEIAKGNIILFIDADIIINENTIPLILEEFSSENGPAAVVGMLSADSPHKNISSRYFNLRKHYDYLLIADSLKNIYTSITAVKKDVFFKAGGFDKSYTGASVEDAEFGRRLHRQGYRITLNKKIKVTHLKKHSVSSLVRSDFRRASAFMKFLIRERLAGNIIKEKRFVSFRMGALSTVSIAPLLMLSVIALPFYQPGYLLFFSCLALFIIANYGFLKFTGQVLGWKRNMLMPLMIFIDSLAIASGIISGALSSLAGRKY